MKRIQVTRLRSWSWLWAVPVIALVGLIAFPIAFPDDIYRQNVLFQTFLLAVGAISWNIVSGFTGYVSLGQSAFLGIGAYTGALISLRAGIDPFLAAPVGGIAAGVLALVVGAIVMRARGHAFVIITIALLLLLQTIGLNASSVTGGSNGLTLPLPQWSSDILNFPFYYSMLLLMVITHLFSMWIRRTKFGTGLIAIREDEGKAASIGVHTTRYKVLSFMASAVFLGVAGGVYAYYLTFIDPRGMFDILVSVSIVLAVLVGGRGSIWGPVLGAFIVQPLNEATNVYAQGSQTRLIFFGGLLMLVVMFLPNGIIPTLSAAIERRRRKDTAVLAIEQDRIAAGGPRVATVEPRPPEPQRPLLEVEHLSKRFGGLKAVDDCSFSVSEGTITALIGPNGSGKTTIFNLVTGMMHPDGGTIRLDGQRIDRLRSWERAHLGLGRSFQITRLFKEMTVLENVVAPLRDFRWRQLSAGAVGGPEARRAYELLDFVGMGKFVDERANILSFGQQKLVELAQVLMLEPKLILLDEPAGGINPSLIERIVELVRDLNRQGITFLLVEHNMPMVLGLCDPVVVVARGSRLAQGSPAEIRRNAEVLDAYLGDEDTSEPKATARMRLVLDGLVAGYGGGNVLRGFDLTVESGSITCLVGPNGAGKSTVLRAISGLLKPSEGLMSYGEARLGSLTCNQILAAGIAQVPQQQALFPAMTIRDNIMMGGYLLRRDKALLRKRYGAIEELIPLVKNRPTEKAGNLSGGERRMIEIGRTLMLEPSLILMDEPSLGLDPRALKQVTDLIALANDQGRTILLVEQNVRLGLRIATHGVIMEGGRVRMKGEPAALLDNPEMASLYLGGTIEQPAASEL